MMILWFANSVCGRRLLKGIVATLLSLSLAVPPATLAARVTLNLKDADIGALIESISAITGKNFIVDPRVKAKITIVSSKPMDEKEIYEVFLAVLAVHGFAAIPGPQAIKIVPAANAKQDAIPTVDQPGRESDDQVITQVVQVQNVAAAQIVPILRPLIPPQGQLAAYAPTNVLIISDTAANVERIADIIRRVDRASDEEIEVVPLRYASAVEAVRTLTTLEQARGQAAAQGGGAAGPPPRVVADERTNSVLLSGDKASRLRLRTLLTHLDTPIAREGNTQVVFLRYAKAKDLADVLSGVSKQIGEQTQQNVPPGGQPGAGRSRSESQIDIKADESSNALVITAPNPEALRSLRSVITQLDVRRAQVLVEAAVAEISGERVAELGVQWVVDGSQGGNMIGFTNFTLGTSLAKIAETAVAIASGSSGAGVAAASGLGSAAPRGLALGIGDLSSSTRFAAIISALAADTDTNVLSTPTLVTMDNEEAEITVGENRPFLTGRFTTSSSGLGLSSGGTGSGTGLGFRDSGLVNPFQTIDRQDVGLKLKIKPQINEGNAVQLEIAQEVSNFAGETVEGPITTKRAVKTNVLVEDGQILVLGGLIDDSLSESVQKVPGLGDIPVLGHLFRYRNTTKRKRNLMVFIHPVILRDASQGNASTNDKYSYIREQQIEARQRGVALMPEAETPLLKPPPQVERQKTLLNLQPQPEPLPPPQSAPPPPAPVSSSLDEGFNSR